MSDRLQACFDTAKAEHRAALVGFLTAGDPNPAASFELLSSLAACVDVLEIGMPFSDPMADGAVIQAASERALAAHTHLDDVFGLCAKLRQAYPKLGIVFMGYANTPYAMGYTQFAKRAKQAGADGALIVDLPIEESSELDAALAKQSLHSIRLLTPTSSPQRMQAVCAKASGFLYYVSLTGITGASMGAYDGIEAQLDNIKQCCDLPICVGFGVKKPEQAQALSRFADGVVVGSHFVQQIAHHLDDLEQASQCLNKQAYVLKDALSLS